MAGRNSNGGNQPQRDDDDNRANQLNPNHDAYWQSRGYDERPEDWQQRDQQPPER